MSEPECVCVRERERERDIAIVQTSKCLKRSHFLNSVHSCFALLPIIKVEMSKIKKREREKKVQAQPRSK